MRTTYLAAGSILLLFSLALMFWLIPWQIEDSLYGEVSPRLLPQICAIGIGVLSLLMIISHWRRDPESDQPPPLSWPELRALLVIGGLLAACIYLFTLFGPLVASVLLIVGILFAMGERRPLPYLVIPATLLALCWLLFYKILGTAIV